jgi:hypothetical protein
VPGERSAPRTLEVELVGEQAEPSTEQTACGSGEARIIDQPSEARVEMQERLHGANLRHALAPFPLHRRAQHLLEALAVDALHGLGCGCRLDDPRVDRFHGRAQRAQLSGREDCRPHEEAGALEAGSLAAAELEVQATSR